LSAAQAQSVPPSIDGYVYERFLGPGGFADVFVYRQDLLDREVAIKVLRETVDDDNARRLFVAEANLMARMSAHPNIVSIYSAGVSADRRPYMVMELYPLDHFGKQLDKAPIAYPRVLEVGIKVAAAVEVAHRARIIHRDIKPANILANDYGEPGLTDFGISAVQTDTHTDESLGFSPPYAPKEILDNSHPGDARSDVYSLAASLWAMLAGHSPFERKGVRNTKGEIIARAMNDQVPPLPSGVAPASFEAVLRQGLEKDPDRRPQSARNFAQMLQSVESELGLRETRLVLLDDRTDIEVAVAEVEVERTKQGRGVVVDLEAGSTSPSATKKRSSAISEVAEAVVDAAPTTPRQRDSVPPRADTSSPAGTTKPKPARGETMLPGASGIEAESTVDKRRPGWLWVAAAVAAVSVVVVIGAALAGGGEDARPADVTVAAVVGDVVNPGAVNSLALDPVENLVGRRDGESAVFEWDHESREGVDYVVRRIDGSDSGTASVVEPTFVIVGLANSETPCVTVTARIEGVAQSETSEPVCAAG
jgi:serine/threonine protein kinase